MQFPATLARAASGRARKPFTACLLLLTFAALASSASAQISAWSSGTQMNSIRYVPGATELNGKVYALGGYNGSTGTNTAEVFDPVTNAWTNIASMKSFRSYLAAASVGGKVYAIGGLNGSAYLNTVEAYDPTTNVWSFVAPMSTPRFAPAAAVLNGKIYVFGGYNGSAYVNTAEVYDPVANSWSAIHAMNSIRGHAAAAVLNAKIYVMGGYNNSTYVNTAEVYDPVANSWSNITPMSSARGYLGSFAAGGKVYAVAGLPNCTNTVEAYDPAANSWSAAPSLNGNRYAHAAVVSGNKAYVLGGNNCSSHLRSVEVSTIGTPASAGQLIISEFRLRGPNGANDEFIEIYNTLNTPHTVSSADSSAGYALVASDGTARCIIPNGTVIPARGHFLCTNGASGGSYSLSSYAAPDPPGGYAIDIPDNMGIALFAVADPAYFNLGNRLDAAGPTTEANTLYKEGSGYAPTSTANSESSFVRDMSSGTPKDTDHNETDFLFVTTSAGPGQRLGAPGPENLSSPVNQGGQIKSSLFDPSVSSTSPPNRVRDTTTGSCGAATPAGNCAAGTLTIRRTFTNNTGQTVTRLRFRVVDVTAGQSPPPGTADVRLLSMTGGPVGGKNVADMTLEQPPNQSNGGGLNTTIAATLPAGGLIHGDSINVQFVLGVQTPGNFRFFVIVEALPNPTTGPVASPAAQPADINGGKGSAPARRKSLGPSNGAASKERQ